MSFFKRPRSRRRCPMCKNKLEHSRDNGGALLCPRCLVLWHGDTFEPLKTEKLEAETEGGAFA
ncbi:MAG: hypothetical protein AB1752_00230 [Candidatus Zixiibacteriota bacterium]